MCFEAVSVATFAKDWENLIAIVRGKAVPATWIFWGQYSLTGHLPDEDLSFGSSFARVAQRIAGSAHHALDFSFALNIGVLINDEEQMHQIHSNTKKLYQRTVRDQDSSWKNQSTLYIPLFAVGYVKAQQSALRSER